jgi:predicted MFS family arabinose efflux permease
MASATLEVDAPSLNGIWLTTLILAAGLGVANVYYMQPLLQQVGLEFGVATQGVGAVATAVQLGYAAGMLLLVPLGDMFERRRLMVVMTALSACACALVSMSPNLGCLIAASFALGLCSITPQYAIPFAAQLAPDESRGRMVGYVVSGLLLGILLARTLSGFVGAAFGWRAMFAGATGIQIGLGISMQLLLPRAQADYQGSYGALLRSVVTLWSSHPVFREACVAGASMFGAFSAFWATLIFLLEAAPFGLGARAVGLFGLVGAAGALSTPLVGGLIDKHDPKLLARYANALAVAAFVGLYVWRESLWGLALGVLILDVAVQTAHVCNQGRIFALLPHARSRANTAYMFCYFCGATSGSALAIWAFAAWGWAGTCGVGVALLLLGAIRLAWPTAAAP